MVEKQLGYKYQVYNEIKKGIMTGIYPPGSVMNERKLSEELGISRTPIREGMQILARDGWLQMETYKGTVVREFDPHYMWELTRVRSALELSAIEDAVKNVTEKDLKCLEEIQARSEIRVKKHVRLRNRFSGTAERPRLAVFRSNNHMYAQIIDDTVGKTLVAASTAEKEVKAELEKTNDVAAAAHVGTVIAKRALEKGIKEVVFDRGGFIYHGKVQALADAAREAGLEF